MLHKEYACCFPLNIKLLHYHPRSPFNQFLVGQLHVDHLVSLDPSKLNHKGGCDHVQHHFLRCSGLQPGASGNELRTHHYHYGVFGHIHYGPLGLHVMHPVRIPFSLAFCRPPIT